MYGKSKNCSGKPAAHPGPPAEGDRLWAVCKAPQRTRPSAGDVLWQSM